MRLTIRRTATRLLTATIIVAVAVVGTSGMATAAIPSNASTTSTAKTRPSDNHRWSTTARTPVGTRNIAYLITVVDQWTHWTPDASVSSHAGTLNAGNNYFYCWYQPGERYSDNGRSSDVWLLTDDDTGNNQVYVNDVYLDEWGWQHDQFVLSRC
jgi:hypothetical protein